MEEKKYPIGGFAPGNYHNRCSTCERSFFGDKQAVQCEPCALEAKARFDALDPNEQELLIKRNARIANFMFSGPLTPERDLIYCIVEQWGNAIEMPNMEQWLKDYAATKQPGAVWVKGAPKDYKQYFAKVPSVIIDDAVYNAVIWPIEGSEHWWCVGHGFKFSVHRDKIIAHIDESGTPAAAREEDAVEFAQWLANEGWKPRINTEWARYETIYSDVSVRTTPELYETFKQQKEK